MTTAVPALDADLVRFEPVFAPAATTEPRWVRALLITIALAFALLFLFKFFIATMPLTTNPKIGSLLSMLCPPAITMPASVQTDLAPAITS